MFRAIDLSGLGAYRVYLALQGAASLLRGMIYAVTAIYLVRDVGVDPFRLVLVGTVLEATYFVCNVPTGVVADTYSRRLSVIVGHLIVGVAFALKGLVPVYAFILAVEALTAVGESFIDGALEAWVADELGEDGLERVFLRGGQVGQVGGLVGGLAGIGLATVGLGVPIVVGGVGLVLLGGFLILAMPEEGFRPAPREEAGSWAGALASMRGTLREGHRVVRGRPLLLTLLAVAVVAGAFSEGYDRLWEAQFLTEVGLPAFGGYDPILWFGVINLGGSLLCIAAAEVARRRLDTGRPGAAARALIPLTAVTIAGVVAFALAGSFAFALAAFWAVSMARTLAGPISAAWLNGATDPRVRATVLSAAAQADSFGQLAGGPAVGAVGSAFSLRAALTVSALALTPAIWLYGRTLGRGGMRDARDEMREDGAVA